MSNVLEICFNFNSKARSMKLAFDHLCQIYSLVYEKITFKHIKEVYIIGETRKGNLKK